METVRQRVSHRIPGRDPHTATEDTVAERDRGAARWTDRGTHKSDLRGIAPTGKEVTWMGMDIYYLAGGKIKEV